MMKRIVTLALAATFTIGAVAPAVHAQSPTPQATATGANAPAGPNHAQMQAALQSLGLSPRQKMDAVRIMRAAKDSNQDKATTLKQLEGVLTPDQMNKLKATLMANPPAKP